MASKRERGEYRPIYEALVDGPQFQRLSSEARFVFFAIKLKSGAAGIRLIPGLRAALVEWTGLPEVRVEAALAELQEQEWIELEASVVWIVRGLEFEPSMDPSNVKQRTYLRRYCDTLPSRAIVARFRDRYAHWFEGESQRPTDTPPHRVPDTLSDTLSHGVSDTPCDTPSEGYGIANRSTSTSTSTELKAAAARVRMREEIPEPDPEILAPFEPSHRAVVDRTLAAVPDSQRDGLARTIRGWLDGQGYAGGRAAAQEDIAAGLAEYLAQPAERRRFDGRSLRAFVVDAERRRCREAEREERPPGGDARPIRAVRAARAVELCDRVLELHLGSIPGVQFQDEAARHIAEGRLTTHDLEEIQTLRPLSDIAKARSLDDAHRLAIHRFTKHATRPALAVIA